MTMLVYAPVICFATNRTNELRIMFGDWVRNFSQLLGVRPRLLSISRGNYNFLGKSLVFILLLFVAFKNNQSGLGNFKEYTECFRGSVQITIDRGILRCKI